MVVCITGNGLKTTDALAGRFATDIAVKPKLAAFDEYIRAVDGKLDRRSRRGRCSQEVYVERKDYPSHRTRPPHRRPEVLRAQAADLPGLLAEFDTKFPALSQNVKDENGKLRQFVNVYVNDEDIRFLGGDAHRFEDGDEVMLIPSIAGGRCGQRRFLTLPYDESVFEGC